MVILNRRLFVTRLVTGPLSGNNTSGSSHSEKNDVDENMVVVLVALLCVLLAALVLNSVIHYALRRRREVASNVQAMGLEKRALRKIPVAVFRPRPSVSAGECSICLGEFVDGEKVRVLPECNHEFHVKCVDKWLAEHTSCPNCRHSLVPLKVVDKAAIGAINQ